MARKKKTPTRNPLTSKMPALLRWFRAGGLAAMFVGGVGLMQDPHLFWWAVGLFYLGGAILCIDFYFEKIAKRSKLFIGIGLLVFFAGFLWLVVLVPTPLEFDANFSSAERPAGTELAGIKWTKNYSELNVSIINNTNRAYDDVDILLRPNLPVAKAGLKEHEPGGAWVEAFTPLNVTHAITKGLQTPIELLASDTGFRVRCSHLLAWGGKLEVIMAIVTVKPEWHLPFNGGDPNAYSKSPDLVMPMIAPRINDGEDGHLWFGYSSGGEIYSTRPTQKPSFMDVKIMFTAAQRIHQRSERIAIPDPLMIRLTPPPPIPNTEASPH